MKINIKRDGSVVCYEVELKKQTLLEALNEIKKSQDASLSYNSGCRSGVCGSCAVRVNSKEALACSHMAEDGDLVEPLNNTPLIRDLVVDMDMAYDFNAKALAWQSAESKNVALCHEDEKLNATQSDCILCGSCYSACPVYSVNKEFLGPFSLTRVWRYVSDKRESSKNQKIENIQINGIWDCTLCNACTLVCPQGISSKTDIEKLRARSAMLGFMDTNLTNNIFSLSF